MIVKHNVLWYLLGEGFRNVFNNKKSSGASLAIMCANFWGILSNCREHK